MLRLVISVAVFAGTIATVQPAFTTPQANQVPAATVMDQSASPAAASSQSLDARTPANGERDKAPVGLGWG
jgi:hypothetical protein